MSASSELVQIWQFSFEMESLGLPFFSGYWSQELLVFHLEAEGIQERWVEEFQRRSVEILLVRGKKLQKLGGIDITQQVQWLSNWRIKCDKIFSFPNESILWSLIWGNLPSGKWIARLAQTFLPAVIFDKGVVCWKAELMLTKQIKWVENTHSSYKIRINDSIFPPFLNVPTVWVIHPELQAQPSHSEGIPRSRFQNITQNWVGGNPCLGVWWIIKLHLRMPWLDGNTFSWMQFESEMFNELSHTM